MEHGFDAWLSSVGVRLSNSSTSGDIHVLWWFDWGLNHGLWHADRMQCALSHFQCSDDPPVQRLLELDSIIYKQLEQVLSWFGRLFCEDEGKLLNLHIARCNCNWVQHRIIEVVRASVPRGACAWYVSERGLHPVLQAYRRLCDFRDFLRRLFSRSFLRSALRSFDSSALEWRMSVQHLKQDIF